MVSDQWYIDNIVEVLLVSDNQPVYNVINFIHSKPQIQYYVQSILYNKFVDIN